MIKGIDVSNHQSTFPVTGIDFCIVKATEGRTFVDPKQADHARRARTAGMVVGFYHFLWPGHPLEQARFFVEKAASLSGDVLACDWESTSSGTHASSAEKDAFLREVKRLRPGHKVLLYCNVSDWKTRDTSSYAADGLWIAQYNNRPAQPSITAPWLIHQYTSSPIDTNVARFDSRAAMRAWAEGGSVPPIVAPKETDMPTAAEVAKAVWDFPISDRFRKDAEGKPRLIPAHYFLEYGDSQYDTLLAEIRRLQATEGIQSAAIAELVKAVGTLASSVGDLDPASIVAELTAALESIDIHIDVPDPA